MQNETKPLIFAVVLSFIAIYSVNSLMGFNKRPVRSVTTSISNEINSEEKIKISENEVLETSKKSTDEILPLSPRVTLKNPSISGSIRLKGARFDNLFLNKYNNSIDDDTKKIELFKPALSQDHYFTDLGWLSLDNSLKLPSSSSLWEADSNELQTGKSIVLKWNNNNGIGISRKVTLDENYMFNITDYITNNTGSDIELFPYALINKNILNSNSASSVVHEGVSMIVDDVLKEIKYADLKKKTDKSLKTKGGWIGFSDRYWFSALVIDNDEPVEFDVHSDTNNNVQVSYRGSMLKIKNNQTISYTYRFFAGAKEIKLLDYYKNKQNIKKFDLAVDFGWYYFLTKPFFYILDFLANFIGNMGWAILLFAALLRLLMFPVANKSYTNMAKMKALQPKLNNIKENYGDNPVLVQQATMELYKKEKINPASGCLPMFIQIPVFFSLYKVLNISIEIRHAPFIGWIKDLSAPDPLTLSEMLHIYVPSFINIGVWPIIMGLTMFIQQKLNPAPANKDQAQMFALMPVFFTFMLGHFASGLVIYWTLTNILSIIQQKVILYKNGVN